MTTMEMPIGQPEPGPADMAQYYDQNGGAMVCVRCKFDVTPDDIWLRFRVRSTHGYCIRCFHTITDDPNQPHLKKNLAREVEQSARTA